MGPVRTNRAPISVPIALPPSPRGRRFTAGVGCVIRRTGLRGRVMSPDLGGRPLSAVARSDDSGGTVHLAAGEGPPTARDVAAPRALSDGLAVAGFGCVVLVSGSTFAGVSVLPGISVVAGVGAADGIGVGVGVALTAGAATRIVTTAYRRRHCCGLARYP